LPTISLSPLREGLVFVAEIQLDNISAVKGMLARQGKPIPPPLRLKALIDTGASVCATTKANIEKLQLPAQSNQSFSVRTAGGVIQSRRYHGALFFTGEPTIRTDLVTIQETYIDEQTPFEFVLGMTALSRWDFRYARVEQKMTIESS